MCGCRVFLIALSGLMVFTLHATTPTEDCPQKLAERPLTTASALVRELDGEARMSRLLVAAAKFSSLPNGEQIKVVEKLVAAGNTTPLLLLGSFLKREQQLKLIDDLVAITPNTAATFIANNKYLTADQRFRLLTQIVGNASYGELSYLLGSLKYSLRPSVVRNGPMSRRIGAAAFLGLAAVIPALNRSVSRSGFDHAKDLSATQKAELMDLALKNDPLSVILTATNAPITPDTPLHLPKDKHDLARAIAHFAVVRPDVFPPEWAELSTVGISSREIALGLIRQLYRLSPTTKWMPQTALEIICRSAGIDFATMAQFEYPREVRQDFFRTVLDTEAHLIGPAYADIRIAPDMLEPQNLPRLVELMEQLQGLFFLRGASDQSWAALKVEMGLAQNGIGPANLQNLLGQARGATTRALAEVFRSNGGDTVINAEQLERLREAWSDTNVVTALAGRFYSRRSWLPELKILGRMLKFEMDGRFLELKRFGDPEDPKDQAKARAQTEVLKTPEQQRAWWSPWSELSVFAKTQSEDRADAKKDAALLNQQAQTAGNLLAGDLPAMTDAKVVQLLESKDPIPQTLARLDPADQASLIPLIGQRLKVGSLKVNEVQKLIAYAKFLRPKTNESLGVTPRLNEILTMLKSLDQKRVAQKKTLVVTTTSTALKTTLGLGCLVDAGSCMDPRQGERADVNPSLAIDANTQAIFSTSLTSSDFRSVVEFGALIEALERNVAVNVTFDGATHVYTFERPGSPPITSDPVETFYRRHQLKLGTAKDGLPVIRTERAFTQDHPAKSVMKEQIQSIKIKMADAMGGHVDIEMTSAATRNLPGGTYSDTMNKVNGAGLQKKQYVMPMIAF